MIGRWFFPELASPSNSLDRCHTCNFYRAVLSRNFIAQRNRKICSQTDRQAHTQTCSLQYIATVIAGKVIIRLEAELRPNIEFTLRGNLAVITRSAITPPKVNRIG